MPEICLYEPWTMKTAMPEEIESLLKTNGKKRISYEENDCSRYNTRTQGKSARLHPPTCSAMPPFTSCAAICLIFIWMKTA